MAIPRNLANLANQLDTSGNPPKVQVGDSSVVVTDTGSNGTITFTTDNSERARFTSAGLGIAVTPSAWTVSAVLQLSTGNVRGSTGSAGFGSNWFFDGASKYISTGFASDNYQQDGDIVWRNAPSGTAGGTITWSERMRITAAGDVGIGTASPVEELHVYKGSATGTYLRVENTGGVFYAGVNASGFGYVSTESSDPLLFSTGGNERGQFTSDGYFCLGKTDTNNTTNGVWFSAQASASNFQSFFVTTRADGGASPIYVNRQSSDGTLIQFQQANTDEGSISVSGNTVSYNAFAGSHWSQFQQGRGYNPEVPRGTVLSTIGEMCEWKSVEWTETIEHEATEDKEAWTETIPRRETYLGNLAVGATFEEDSVTKTVVDDGNERLPKVKISDAVGDKAVYGVFQTYDSAQDLLVTSLGAFVVRIAAGVTVQIGDLLESNGDGCAKVQDDDIIRSKTIGKVTSTTATATYDDGSYTVPCVLYCG